jgi:hypothetical protein
VHGDTLKTTQRRQHTCNHPRPHATATVTSVTSVTTPTNVSEGSVAVDVARHHWCCEPTRAAL